MKKIYVLLLISLSSFNSSVYAQDFWEVLPFPDSVKVSSLAINSQGDIFVITSTESASDGVYRSQDGGETWELVYQFYQTAGGNSIAISEEGNIFVVTNHGVNNFLKSYDNGNTWTLNSLPTYNGGSAVKIVSIGSDTLYVSKWDWGATLIRSVDGGISWDLIFVSTGNGDEYVRDLLKTKDGNLIIALTAYDINAGGIYMSIDDGSNWELLTLISHQIMDIQLDTSNNLLIADRSNLINGTGGIFKYSFNNQQTDTLLFGPNICGIITNAENKIFASSTYGILYSSDGMNFDFINSGIPFQAQMGDLQIDSNGYVYALTYGPSNYIFKTIEPTITNIESPSVGIKNKLWLFPNPINEGNDLNLKLDQQPGNYEYKIYDSYGRMMSNGNITINESIIQLDTSNLKKGIYLISISNETNHFTSKFISN